uniref:Uncharacterized protein n=1 Tax=Romanomermis culicivorax TaxID=13658 RepID=A0A915K7L6_ROMCU
MQAQLKMHKSVNSNLEKHSTVSNIYFDKKARTCDININDLVLLTNTQKATQPTPNFQGYTLVGFDTESIMARDMKNFKFTVPMPANCTASSYWHYVQLPFPYGTMFVFETFAEMLEDWMALFFLIDGEHIILISFDGADD